ncbi:MAG: tetratricopeptide repeat protein, partial [Deltaproteobacteria bacterium]|nr:tetratricopeptide repeat protein [Deltaproteobacteria bacterium]
MHNCAVDAVPEVAVGLGSGPDFLRKQRDLTAALADAEHAKRIAEKVPGTAHPLYHTVATTVGEILLAAGRLD